MECAYWFWRPIAPDGYVSLGLVIGDPGLELGDPVAPATDLVMCVRSDLVVPAPINPAIVSAVILIPISRPGYGRRSPRKLRRVFSTSTPGLSSAGIPRA
jgi:Vacuolar protein sorting-associated protein 62